MVLICGSAEKFPAFFIILLIIISLVICIIGSIAVSFRYVDLVDDAAENMAIDVVYSLFEVAQTLAAGFADAADQHNAADLLGQHQDIGKAVMRRAVQNDTIIFFGKLIQ